MTSSHCAIPWTPWVSIGRRWFTYRVEIENEGVKRKQDLGNLSSQENGISYPPPVTVWSLQQAFWPTVSEEVLSILALPLPWRTSVRNTVRATGVLENWPFEAILHLNHCFRSIVCLPLNRISRKCKELMLIYCAFIRFWYTVSKPTLPVFLYC